MFTINKMIYLSSIVNTRAIDIFYFILTFDLLEVIFCTYLVYYYYYIHMTTLNFNPNVVRRRFRDVLNTIVHLV